LKNTLTKSNNIAIVGEGLIGKRLAKFVNPTHTFNSKTLLDLPMNDYDTVYIAAPTSNRIWATNNPNFDTASTELLIRTLLATKTRRVVLISTCDTQVNLDTVYGANRLKIENLVKSWFHYYHIIRLPSLIGNDITKNIIYDIKYKTEWCDKINVGTVQQWYILDDLEQDLKEIMSGTSMSTTNLVSEPISNRDIVAKFYKPNDEPIIGTTYNLMPYKYTKEEIFDAISLYMR
jgi:hypothetical protein